MKGATYFKPWGFSINEGQLPNIHISWNLAGGRRFYFYLAITRQLRVSFSFPWWPKSVQTPQLNG